MARIAGVELPSNKRVEIGLMEIYGIGRSLSRRILKDTQINPEDTIIIPFTIIIRASDSEAIVHQQFPK